MRALIFDFDGVVVDTESPEYDTWEEIYQEHGSHLPLEVWVECIGRAPGYFDPCADLEERIGRGIDRQTVAARRRKLWLGRVSGPLCPGVAEHVAEARHRGLALAIASSSSRRWVTDHLERVGLAAAWACIRCRDDVVSAKPAPDLYLAVLEAMRLRPDEAVAIEDSPNGIAAAKAAGLRCVAVPGPMTSATDLSQADVRIGSLAELSLADLLRRLDASGS